MRHDWILAVLTDLQTYAQGNDLPALAAQVEMTLAVARAEMALAAPARAGPNDKVGQAPPARPNRAVH